MDLYYSTPDLAATGKNVTTVVKNPAAKHVECIFDQFYFENENKKREIGAQIKSETDPE